MDHLCTMELFGMQIQCRPDWRIVPDHKYTLTYDSGLFRFEENVEERRSRVSLGLRWECSMTDSETFLEEFRENIQAEYRKAIKGKGRRFELLRDEIVERPDGTKICLVETKYGATQALVPDPKKMQRLYVCNAAYYCEESHRMLICSVVTTPQYMDEHRDELMEMLTSVRSRSIYTPEEEAQRMEKRAKRRAEATQRSQHPFASLFKGKEAAQQEEQPSDLPEPAVSEDGDAPQSKQEAEPRD